VAAGIAAAGLALSYRLDAPAPSSAAATTPPSSRGSAGAIVWAVGAFLLAKQPEGDDDWHGTERVSTSHTAH
jgi:hypothetical protein